MSIPLVMNTKGLIAPAGVVVLPINTNGHLCYSIIVPPDPVADGGGRMNELHRQRILEDDKIVLNVIKNFMESITTCH